MRGKCGHLDSVQTDTPRSQGCEECLKLGESWSWCYVDELVMELAE